MAQLVLACIAALASAALYASAVTLQALEARSAPVELHLRPSLIGFLLRRRRWLLGTALGILGWPLQAVALAFAPLALVQPILALSVVGLLVTGHRVLGEPVGRRNLAAVAGILVGIALLALEAPTRADSESGVLPALTLVALAAVALVPFARVRRSAGSASFLGLAAGAAYVVLALATTLLDGALGREAWWIAAVWLAVGGAGSAVGGLTEMSAFRLAPATVVAPIIFCTETVVPALLAPVVGQRLGTDLQSVVLDLAGLSLVGIGVTLLTRSRPVANLVAAGSSASS
jgi:drug/metabolite transporter (DMT)-like permease